MNNSGLGRYTKALASCWPGKSIRIINVRRTDISGESVQLGLVNRIFPPKHLVDTYGLTPMALGLRNSDQILYEGIHPRAYARGPLPAFDRKGILLCQKAGKYASL